MNRLVHTLLVATMLASPAIARQSPVVQFPVVIDKADEVKIEINLGKITSKDQISESRLNELLTEALRKYENRPELTCTVTVTGELTVGVAKVEISVSVSGPCSEVKAQGAAIANMILDAVKKALE